MSADGVETKGSACLLPGTSRLKSLGRLTLFFFANSFERAVFRGALADERRKFYFADDRIGCFKLAFARQHSRVASHIADQELHRAGERYRIFFSSTPPCLRIFGPVPNSRSRVRCDQTAFSIRSRFKAR